MFIILIFNAVTDSRISVSAVNGRGTPFSATLNYALLPHSFSLSPFNLTHFCALNALYLQVPPPSISKPHHPSPSASYCSVPSSLVFKMAPSGPSSGHWFSLGPVPQLNESWCSFTIFLLFSHLGHRCRSLLRDLNSMDRWPYSLCAWLSICSPPSEFVLVFFTFFISSEILCCLFAINYRLSWLSFFFPYKSFI